MKKTFFALSLATIGLLNSCSKNDSSPTLATSISIDGFAESPKTTRLAVGTKLEIKSTILPEDASNKTATYTSNNTSVASVMEGADGAATITALAEGTAIITAITKDGSNFSDTIQITIVKPNPTDASFASLNFYVSDKIVNLDKIFDNDIFDYIAIVPGGTTSVSLKATTTQPAATFTLNGNKVANNSATPIALVNEEATASIDVTSGNGSSKKTYTIKIITASKITDTRIKSFVLKSGGITYNVTVDGDELKIQNPPRTSTSLTGLTGTVMFENPKATISPNPATARSYENDVVFTVTAEDGKTTKKYTVKNSEYDATNNPYGIYTAADLSEVRNGLDKNYKLMNDIALPTTSDSNAATITGITDYADNGWLPIGTLSGAANTPFTGIFDGAGHIITGLEGSRTTMYNGLFASIDAGAVVKNVGVQIRGQLVGGSGSDVNGIGGLIGRNLGNVSNCYVTGGEITGNISCGGLIGVNVDTGVVSNCYGTTQITANNGGGIIGYNFPTAAITNCYWDTQTSTKTTGAGGTGKTTTEMKTQDAVDDLNGTQDPKPWEYVAGQYPKLVKKN